MNRGLISQYWCDIPFFPVAPFAVLLSKRFEAGYIIIACGAVTGLSGIAAAFVVTPLQLAVLYALLAGRFTVHSSRARLGHVDYYS